MGIEERVVRHGEFGAEHPVAFPGLSVPWLVATTSALRPATPDRSTPVTSSWVHARLLQGLAQAEDGVEGLPS